MGLSKLLICLVICLLETENRFVVSNTLIQIHDRGTQSINNQFQLITVDIKNCSTNSEVVCDYNTSDNSSTFTANPGYLINKVTKRDTVLWDAEDYNNVYSNRVFVGFNESLEPIFRVYFPGEPPKLSVPVPPKPLKPDLTKPTLITLDVKIKEPTNEILYEYDKRNQTHTFTPLPGFAIDRVVKGRNQMWKCEDGVYPEKVLIILDQGGDQVLRFQFPEPEHHTKGVEIITEGSKKPNDGSKIELIRVCRGRFHFIPKPGSKCIMVKCDGQVLWRYGDYGCQEYPRNVRYTNGLTLAIHLGRGFIYYEKCGKRWYGLPHDIETAQGIVGSCGFASTNTKGRNFVRHCKR